MTKHTQTRDEKEMAITMVSIALWGAIVLFIAVAVLFLLDIIPSNNGVLIGIILLAIAALDWVVMKIMVGKMQAELDKTPND